MGRRFKPKAFKVKRAPRAKAAPGPKFAPVGGGSHLEERFKNYWKDAGGGELVREYHFHPTRKWRFDFCDPHTKIAIEIEGGIFMRKGRHTSASGFIADAEKYNTATMMGWKVIRLPPPAIEPQYVAELVAFVRGSSIAA